MLEGNSDEERDDDMMILHGLAAAVGCPRLSIFLPVPVVYTW